MARMETQVEELPDNRVRLQVEVEPGDMRHAVERHIGGWFRAAAARSRIRPVAQPEYGYDPPASADESFRFTATVAVQPKPELPDWSGLEAPYAEPEVPEELVERELEALRSAVAELVPVEDRPGAEGDTLVVDLVGDT